MSTEVAVRLDAPMVDLKGSVLRVVAFRELVTLHTRLPLMYFYVPVLSLSMETPAQRECCLAVAEELEVMAAAIRARCNLTPLPPPRHGEGEQSFEEVRNGHFS